MEHGEEGRGRIEPVVGRDDVPEEQCMTKHGGRDKPSTEDAGREGARRDGAARDEAHEHGAVRDQDIIRGVEDATQSEVDFSGSQEAGPRRV